MGIPLSWQWVLKQWRSMWEWYFSGDSPFRAAQLTGYGITTQARESHFRAIQVVGKGE